MINHYLFDRNKFFNNNCIIFYNHLPNILPYIILDVLKYIFILNNISRISSIKIKVLNYLNHLKPQFSSMLKNIKLSKFNY